jgi:hypothetical protein
VRQTRIGQLVLGLTIAVCMTGCQDGGTSKKPDAGKDAAKDTAEVGRQPDAPVDLKLPSEPIAERIGGPEGGSGPEAAPPDSSDARGGLDTDKLDGGGPSLDVAEDGVPDAPADVPQGDLPVDRVSVPPLDGAPVCVEGTKEACASPGNPLLGACRAGTHACSGGVWGPCSEVLPAAREDCNGVDDNCNGMIDEGCAASCIVVCGKCSSADDAAAADGSVEHPYTTIEAALKAASPIDGGTRRRICVVGGATCRESTLYPTEGPLKMTDGLVIQGAYAITENGLEYCPGANLRPRTTLSFSTSEGVVFDQAVAAGAELSSMVIEINPPADSESATAIAVKGGKNATLSRVFVTEGFSATNTTGVAITAGGQATIAGSSISTGQGRASAVGVYVTGGTVNLRNNCDWIVDGRCESHCADGGAMLGVHGYVPVSPADAPVASSGVFIKSANASSMIATMVCAGSSNIPDGQSVATVAALRCEGTGCETVSRNVMVSGDDRAAVGVALIGANPLVDSNDIEGGCGSRTANSTAVWLEASSARLQNNRIFGGQCPGAGTPVFTGLHLVARGTSPSPDVHSNTIEPPGIATDCQSIGVVVEPAAGADGATAGVLRNNIISAGECNQRFAISEATGASLQSLRNNDLYGPSATAATGLVLYRHAGTDATTIAQVNAIALAGGNISANPAYAAYPTDLHLSAQSPCIDQGGSSGAPTSDGAGHARPAGAGYDIGAYEFVVGSVSP